jgi:hypothetical protein
MTTQNAPARPWMSLLAGCAIASCLAFAPSLAAAMADVVTNPIAQPNIQISNTLPVAQPGEQTYVLTLGKTVKQVKAKTIRVHRRADGTVTGVFVDAVKIAAIGTVSVSVATGTGSNSNSTAQYSQSTTTTSLPGGGTRTDIDHGDGSSTTTIHDPAGGKNGGTRTTTSSTDTEGNTTTTTTTTDGGDGSTTTTTTTSP